MTKRNPIGQLFGGRPPKHLPDAQAIHDLLGSAARDPRTRPTTSETPTSEPTFDAAYDYAKPCGRAYSNDRRAGRTDPDKIEMREGLGHLTRASRS